MMLTLEANINSNMEGATTHNNYYPILKYRHTANCNIN